MDLNDFFTSIGLPGAAAPTAVVPLPRPQASAGAGGAPADSPPRIKMTGEARSNVGGQPLSVEPISSSGGGSDPYASVPRLPQRTGLRRFGYDAMSGIAASNPMDSPLSAFADSYLGSQKAEADQTAAERTAQIDEINRQQERQRYSDEQARNARKDAADLAQKSARTDLLKTQAAHGGFAGRGLDQAKYYDLLIRKEVELNRKYGLNDPNLSADNPRRAEMQAKVDADFAVFKTELQQSMGGGGGPGAGDGGITQSEAGDIALQSGETPVAAGQPGRDAAPTQKTRGIEPKGAIPDNISGDGSLHTPFRVKNPKDPTIRAKIKVGDHFYYTNPQTGKEEIRVRDR